MKTKSAICHEHQNTYMVNIYLRDSRDPNFLVGTIRFYGENDLKIFSTITELLRHITGIFLSVDKQKSANRRESGARINEGAKENSGD